MLNVFQGAQGRGKRPEADGPPDADEKDPWVRERTHDTPGEDEEEEEEEEENTRVLDPRRPAMGKLPNSSLSKHELDDSTDAADFKSDSNARTAAARKRTRSGSRSSSSSPERKDGRSPECRPRSTTSSSSSHPHGEPSREDRAPPRKSPSDPERGQRPPGERHGEGREAKENGHRWRSGWQENTR